MKFFGLKYGHNLENCAAHPHQEFLGVPPLPPPGTAAQIALTLTRRKGNQHQISIFIYLFILSPLPYKHLRYPYAKHAVIFRVRTCI